ncbi:hypothetical protein [Flavobacterium sp.]|uniref:hypothetical protein n=1 Tax=Flavobacterium sp. TaxID=239 RepID=UPI003D6ABD65
MSDFLRKIKLLDNITIELDSTKNDFIRGFQKNVDESDLNLIDSFFEALTFSKNEYKGTVDNSVFKLRRRRKIFDNSRSFAVAEGTMKEKEGKLVLETDIKGFHSSMKFFYVFLFVIYLVFLTTIILTFLFNEEAEAPLFIFPIFFIHALLMLGIPYFIMRRSVSRMKYELERDFHFWTK